MDRSDENHHHHLNRDILRDCLSTQIVQKTRVHSSDAKKSKRQSRQRKAHSFSKPENADEDDVTEIADFVDYLTSELFLSFPQELRCISFAAIKSDEVVLRQYSDPLPPSTLDALIAKVPVSVTDSLEAYRFINPGSEKNFLVPIFQNYANTATTPPPTHDPSTRATACEICERDWVPLSYHHLIPREVHAKATKRGWHEEWELQSVAWLCRACHSFVHQIESNEELAKNWWSVKRLMSRADVQGWARWVGRVRWKAR